MRTRIDNYTFTPNTRSINSGIADLTIEDIRLIINETKKIVICSSMQKDNIDSVTNGVITYKNTITALASGDEITLEVDKGEDYPSIAGMTSEIVSGKSTIASAINAKGGTASASSSFNQLATDITNIPTTVQVEDAAKLAFPESMSWNILALAYEKQRVGYKSWIVAEYFKGYDSLALDGADAFLTCDGDFYTTPTTHVWHDDSFNKVNRYIVYYFIGENIPFSVTQESVCPRSMAVMGKFSSINIASVGRIRQIYNGGTINDISFASTNPAWGQEVFISGVKEHNSGYIVNGNANVQLFASDIETLNGGLVVDKTVNLTTATLNNLTTINGGNVFGYNQNSGLGNLKNVFLPSLKKINGGFVFKANSSYGFTKLTIQNLEEISYGSSIFNNDYNQEQLTTQTELRFPKLTKCNGKIFSPLNSSINFGKNVIIIEIGQNFNRNFDIRHWIATNAIKDNDNSLVEEGETFANNREKFLYNFEHLIVDKLADNSVSGLAYTLTVKSTTVFPVVNASATITAKLTAKNWTLAGA